jgi:drug/metabolite transporter (DMT)-like permease
MLNAVSTPKLAARWLPYAALTGALCIFSTGAVFVRMAQAEGVPSLAIAVLRYLMAASILTLPVLMRHRADLRRIAARDVGWLGLAGVTFALSLLFFFLALENTTILIANLFTNTHPLWVAVAEVVILKAALSRRVWWGVGLALAGGALFTIAGLGGNMGLDPLRGMLFALGSALLSTVYFILGRAVRARVPTMIFLWLALTAGAVAMLLATLFTGTSLTGYSGTAYVWIVLVAITGQVIGQALLTYCMAFIPATFVSVSMLAQVILSAILAFVVFHEQPGPVQLVASVGLSARLSGQNRLYNRGRCL